MEQPHMRRGLLEEPSHHQGRGMDQPMMRRGLLEDPGHHQGRGMEQQEDRSGYYEENQGGYNTDASAMHGAGSNQGQGLLDKPTEYEQPAGRANRFSPSQPSQRQTFGGRGRGILRDPSPKGNYMNHKLLLLHHMHSLHIYLLLQCTGCSLL